MKFLQRKVAALATANGFRFAAVSILNTYLDNKYGLSLSEFPDSIEIANIKDELEDMLRTMIEDDSFQSEEIMYFLNNSFDDSFVERTMMD